MPRSLYEFLFRPFNQLGVGQTLALWMALVGVVGGAMSVTALVEQRYKTVLENRLQTVLNSTNQAMKVWAIEHYRAVENFSSNQVVIEAANTLLEEKRDQKALLTSHAQAKLRRFFSTFIDNGQYRGYFIISLDNTNIASSRDSNIASQNLLITQPDVLSKMRQGDSVMSRIQRSDVPLYDHKEDKTHATMFVGAPIRNSQNQIIALLTLRIDPHNSLFTLLWQGQLGKTGETYMFSRDGLMLSDSRFPEQLLEIGLLEHEDQHRHDDERGYHGHLQITLRDPGEDLTIVKRLPPALAQQPLTRMAASATAKNSGVDLDGYRDYRGVPVVGAWLWDEEFNVGLTTEQDLEEAYSLFYFVRALLYGGALIVILILLSLTQIYNRGRQRLLATQHRLTAVVDNIIDSIVVINDSGVIEDVNPMTEKIFGYSRQELVGRNVSMLMAEPYASHHDGYIKRYLQSGEARIIDTGREVEARHADGNSIPIELGVSLLELEDGLRFVGVIRDISARKKSDGILNNERIFNREVLDSLTAHIAVLDENGIIIMTNEAWNDFGVTNGLPSEAGGVGINYLDIVYDAIESGSEELLEMYDNLKKMLTGESERLELEYPCHCISEQRWFSMRASRFLHAGHPIIVVSHQDITKRILFEQQLRTMSLVANNTDNAVIVTNVNGEVTWVNSGFTRMSEYEQEEVVGRRPGSFLQGPDTDQETVSGIRKAIGAGESIDGEILNYSKSGKPYWQHFEIRPVRDEKGEIVEFVALERDITEEKRMVEALRHEKEATEYANTILNMTREALERTGIAEFWVSAKDGRVLRVNDHACDSLGYSQKEILDLSVPDFDIKYLGQDFQALLDSIKEKSWARFESVHQTKDGRRIPVEVTAIHLPDFQDYGEMFIAFVSDITQRKEAEIELILARDEADHANRAKSTFLATMSHEIRTPLNGVVGTVDMLTHTDLDKSQLDLVETAKDSALLLQGIIDDILDFSKIEAGHMELEKVSVDMESLVEKLADSLRHIARNSNVELLIFCDPDLPDIEGDPVRLRQILFNLTGNAIKFSSGDEREDGGQVTIKVLLNSVKNDRVDFSMRVIDNGIGMSSEVMKRLFTPFVQGEGDTTRRFGGTGLGLVITQRLVELMGGSIEVDSAEGEGSTFSIYLSMRRAINIDTAEKEKTSLDGLKVVLVSSDEAGWILKNYLEHAGTEVISAQAEDVVKTCLNSFPEDSKPVVVLDTQNDRKKASALRNVMREKLEDVDLRFVMVERGQRHYARPDGVDGMTLDMNAMRRSSLLNAVASVVGRETPEQREKVTSEISNIDRMQEQIANEVHMILLVDDNQINRKVISQQLELLGYRIETAENGFYALNMWRDGNYSLVMTDCHMPEMDGYQLTSAIRGEEEEGRHIPVIAITADALKGTAQKCFDFGMDDYLTKPLKLPELRQTLNKWLPTGVNSKEKHIYTSKELTQHEVIDPLALGQLLGTQEPDFLAEYYCMFLDTSFDLIKQLQSAANNGDFSTVRRKAHEMKTSARTIGANNLADSCQRLEKVSKESNMLGLEHEMQTFPGLFDKVRKWIETHCNCIDV